MNTIKLKGTYDFVIKRADGSIKESWSVDNLLMNAGFAQLALLAGDAAAVPFTYIAIGSGDTAPGATQTTLVTEITDSGLARHAGTVSRVQTTVASDTFQVLYEFTATATITLKEVGIFNDATVGTMLSRALTGTKTLLDTEKYQVTYKLKFS
jgi:hypothetical protein